MNEYTLRPFELLEILWLHKYKLLISLVLTTAVVMTVFKRVKRVYSTEATIHVGINYFQDPLIGELVTQMLDSSELRAERELIIKASLGVKFATKVGEKWRSSTKIRSPFSRVISWI